jgi:type IV pilus assembly protein PilN
MCLLLLVVGWEANTLLESNKEFQANQQHLLGTQKTLDQLRGGPKKTLTSAERALIEKEYEVVADLVRLDAFRWSALLDHMEELLPDGVSLSGFQPDYKKKSLTLSGQAVGLKEMRLFLDRLLKTSDFEQVYLTNHSRIKVLDYAKIEHSAISFSLQLEGVF